jgi:hypothetical protein
MAALSLRCEAGLDFAVLVLPTVLAFLPRGAGGGGAVYE